MNVSDGKTKSLGIELELLLRSDMLGSLALVGTWNKHRYDFSQRIGGGEIIESGKDVDTAPRWMGSIRWGMDWRESISSELEFTFLDEYWMDAYNTHQYGGALAGELAGELAHSPPA